ncbi:MAG: 50S ribosomal protein L11 [Phycisphaerales bacterium]|jgi:large subunit ribosomal protein L11|nr:50S ribosomal protein L11 [Phycisphaerales bacterium]
MAKKEIKSTFKIMAPGGSATPAPPLGPVLGANGVNPGQFIQQFNAKTAALKGKIVGCVVTTFTDKSFTFEIKSSPASVLIKERAKIEKGSGVPNKNKVGKLKRSDLEAIAKEKIKDLNTDDIAAAARMIEGQCRNMGVVVEG